MSGRDMTANPLKSLSMEKYARLLPRLFAGAARVEIHDRRGEPVWIISPGQVAANDEDAADEPVVAWADFGAGIERRQLPSGDLQFRSALLLREEGKVAWLRVTYEIQASVPMSTAPEALRRAFADALAFLQQEVELQSECDQLAIELTERYEELNLVYSTQDQVEYFEEGQEALVRLVRNCADYLDVALAALIVRDRDLVIHDVNKSECPAGVEEIMDLLANPVYDYVEAHVRSVVLNETEDEERRRLFGNRSENLLAYPIIDDHGTAIGLLAVIARQKKHTFSNGDRNLLEVMAKKASRIIHTHHDSLTGLINRSGFESSLVSMLQSSRNNNVQHSLLHIDMDQLHVVNDLMGHEVGDNLIRRVAKSLRACVRDSDLLARLGGDEFAVLLTNCDVRQAHTIANKIRNAIHELTVVSAKRQLEVSASIGIAAVTPQTEGIVGIMASAEIACKSAKEAGKDRIQVFEEDNTTLVRRSEEIEWIGRVQQALRDDQFELHCQPVLPLVDQARAPHFEILVRMLDDDGQAILPGQFLPAAERYQLMPLVDRWVIRNALRCLADNWATIADRQPVFCINLSGQSLTNTGFLPFVSDELAASRIPPRNICFEITETAAISNIDEAIDFMGHLRGIGCRFALDDFGAGLSSFGYLKVLPVDYLKIDGSFVQEVTTDDVSHSMVSAISQIGRTMGLSIIAEFVCDEATMDVLARIGVDFVQGFGVGKPESLIEVVKKLPGETSAASA